MSTIHVAVVSPEEAYNGNAEFWCGRDLMAVTVLHESRLCLQIDPRRDGRPWLLDTASLAAGLAEATRLIAAY